MPTYCRYRVKMDQGTPSFEKCDMPLFLESSVRDMRLCESEQKRENCPRQYTGASCLTASLECTASIRHWIYPSWSWGARLRLHRDGWKWFHLAAHGI